MTRSPAHGCATVVRLRRRVSGMLLYLQTVPEYAAELPGYDGSETNVDTGRTVQVCAGVAMSRVEDSGSITVHTDDDQQGAVPYGLIEGAAGVGATMDVTVRIDEDDDTGLVGLADARWEEADEYALVRFAGVQSAGWDNGMVRLTWPGGRDGSVNAYNIAAVSKTGGPAAL